MTEDSKKFVIGELILENLRDHNLNIPISKTVFKIPEANTVLRDTMEYFVGLEGRELVWRPEYDQVADWLSDTKGRGLFMYGNCGLGKSILGRYVIPGLLLHYFRKVVCVYDTKEMNLSIDDILKMNIFSLDDIGTEEISNKFGNRRMAFSEIMDEVEKKSKIVIISTNLSGKDEIVDKYGTRVYERIISTTERVKFTGKSLRQ